MTINDAMRALAESLEPEPSYKPSMRIAGIKTELEGQHSKLGFWRWWSNRGWDAVNFLTSESASALLLDAMRECARHGSIAQGRQLARDILEDLFEKLLMTDCIRKTAVFLAALAWKGIERPTDI